MKLFHTVTNLQQESGVLRLRPYGVIEMDGGRLSGVHLRPCPKFVSLPEVWWLGGRLHNRVGGDRFWLYYNQPRRCPNYLTLKYAVSSSGCTFMTMRRALAALDWIAKLKQSDAILCEAFNARLSDRLMRRFGWERHLPSSRRRHYIKRFYGEYPSLPEVALWTGRHETETAELQVAT